MGGASKFVVWSSVSEEGGRMASSSVSGMIAVSPKLQ